MDRKQIKNDVLQELIELMESKELEGLKSKSPKFMKVETNDPEMADSVMKKAMSENMDDQEDPPMDLPSEDSKKEMVDDHEPMEKMNSEEDPEDLKRLLEMYHKLK